MSEENTSDNITYINGQKVYDEDFVEPLVPPLPKSPIEFSIEQAGFLTKELASANSTSKNLAEQNAFIIKELASSKSNDKQLAEQQASILLLLANQISPPVEEDNDEPEDTPSNPPVEENPDAPVDDTDNPEEIPVEEPNEEDTPKEGDGQ